MDERKGEQGKREWKLIDDRRKMKERRWKEKKSGRGMKEKKMREG